MRCECVINPSRRTKKKTKSDENDADGSPWDSRIPSLDIFLPAACNRIIKQGKINYSHFLNILIEYPRARRRAISLGAPANELWFISRRFPPLLSHREKNFAEFPRREMTRERKHIDNINCYHNCTEEGKDEVEARAQKKFLAKLNLLFATVARCRRVTSLSQLALMNAHELKAAQWYMNRCPGVLI